MQKTRERHIGRAGPGRKGRVRRGPVYSSRGRKITIDRIFRASPPDLWEYWATKKGLEAWWGPEGFRTKVRRLELRPGGVFEYEMAATGPEQVEAMKQANLPLTSQAHGTYVQVTPGRRLAYRTVADFIPGVEPYEVGAVIDFHPVPLGTRLTVSEDVMHNEEWTRMSEAGMSSSLDRLRRLVEARRGRG